MSDKACKKELEKKILDLEKIIAELRQAESRLINENIELKEIKKYFDVLMQNTEDYILVCDREGVPRAFNRVYKETVERLLGIEMKPGVEPFKISQEARAREYWETLQKKALQGEKFVSEFYDDIGEGFYETIFCPVNEGKKITGFTEITRNITDRKKIEKALEKANLFTSSLLENVPIAILVINTDSSIRYVNPRFEKYTGYTSEEILGAKFPYPWIVDDTINDDMAKRVIEGVHLSERQYKKKNGEYSWVDIEITPIRHNGELSYFLGTWIDIDERKRSEMERKKLEEKLHRSQTMESLGLLAGGVAHDLNNVLAGIVSYPDLLLADPSLDEKLKRPLTTIKEAGDRAAAIVQDLLTIGRGVATEKNILNINKIIVEYLGSPEFDKLQQYHPGVSIKTNFETSLLNIKGSYIHLRKALMNLVSNASEAIEDCGDVIISTNNCFLDTPLKGYDEIQAGEYIVISIADTGTGISSNDLERIFEPFFTKKVMGRSGTGLGLAVVWNVIRDHNGYINVKSDNKGTVFELYFPITRDGVFDENLISPVDGITGHGEKILIIDDVESQRDICRQILEKLGYTVHTVKSGEAAIKYLEHNSADLILLDMIMDPGINGRETYEKIIEIHPRQRAVLMSGYAETDEVKATQKLGAGAMIKKPITLHHLGITIKQELAKNR
ncbi:MAG: PAS domain S-box protein [Deltaproteobacteria bacterium]|nr:PAS domain S-box protein [Deltaproteobacteria bacterium]